MSNLEQELTKLAASQFFANLDFVQSYWQLPLDPSSQSCQSFIKPDGVYSATRVANGTPNAVTHLRSSLTLTTPDQLNSNLLLWFYDWLLYSTSVPHFMSCVRQFLQY